MKILDLLESGNADTQEMKKAVQAYCKATSLPVPSGDPVLGRTLVHEHDASPTVELLFGKLTVEWAWREENGQPFCSVFCTYRYANGQENRRFFGHLERLADGSGSWHSSQPNRFPGQTLILKI